jgi:hypothetical protein
VLTQGMKSLYYFHTRFSSNNFELQAVLEIFDSCCQQPFQGYSYRIAQYYRIKIYNWFELQHMKLGSLMNQLQFPQIH